MVCRQVLHWDDRLRRFRLDLPCLAPHRPVSRRRTHHHHHHPSALNHLTLRRLRHPLRPPLRRTSHPQQEIPQRLRQPSANAHRLLRLHSSQSRTQRLPRKSSSRFTTSQRKRTVILASTLEIASRSLSAHRVRRIGGLGGSTVSRVCSLATMFRRRNWLLAAEVDKIRSVTI